MVQMNHFLHQHPLVLSEQKVSSKKIKKFVCEGCHKGLSGLVYGCLFCKYYLHKSCAELPRQIQIFFHPCPLFLTLLGHHNNYCEACSGECTGLRYFCEGCDFTMHVECVQQPAIESDEEVIQHFTHWHPLKLVDEPNKHLELECAICDQLCSAFDSSAYGCEECSFFICESCVSTFPQKINHLFHPSCPLILRRMPGHYKCNGCDEAASGFAFRCGKCDFQLDVKCGLLPTLESTYADKIQHFAHSHPLALCERKEFSGEVRCRVCEENFVSEPYFGCTKSCDFFLHSKCAVELQPEMHHPFHPEHALVLIFNEHYKCKACDNSYQSCLHLSLTYGCKECKFLLDVKCALFPTIDSEDAKEIRHCSHNHPLALQESVEFGSEVRCRACGESCLTSCFGCTECNFVLHRHCAIELHPEKREIHHPFHPLHPLTLSSPPPVPDHDTFHCASCLGLDDCNLLRYRCDKCDFDLHINCAKPKLKVPVFKYEGHTHHLTYFDKTLTPIKCNICQEYAQTCFFRCVACAFNIHIYCIPLTPKTIEHQRHLHPLTVTKPPFNYELISPEYADGSDYCGFYCDACEDERYKFEQVYYCEKCKFIVEVRCVINELLPSLTSKGVLGRVVSREYEIGKSKDEERDLKKKVEMQAKELKSLEEKLERKTCKLRKLKTDHFMYKYITSVTRKNPTNASAFIEDAQVPPRREAQAEMPSRRETVPPRRGANSLLRLSSL